MVRKIHVAELRECPDKEWLGRWCREEDYDEYIQDEDVDVYLDGKLVLVYRPASLQTLLNIAPEDYAWWRWCSSRSEAKTDQRGHAGGSEVTDHPEIRLTGGQHKFFLAATKGKVQTLEEAREIANSDTSLSRQTFYAGKVDESEYVDPVKLEEYRWGVLARNVTAESLEAKANHHRERLKWFDNWLSTTWAEAEDKEKAAKDCKKRFLTNAPRANRVYPAVVGTLDRTARTPYGRNTAPVRAKPEEFARQQPFYHEVSEKLKETMPESWTFLYDKFKKVADPAYNLFDTCFTSVTVNWNFRTAYHRDGNNCEGGIAVLSSINTGTYEGFGLVFPELRLGFHIGTGDFLAGDNQGLIHGQREMLNASPDAESIWFVFYSREKIPMLETLENETCRKNFMDHAAEHHREKCGEKQPDRWNGIWPEMWSSPEWETYKSKHCPTAKNTHHGCKENDD
jgi:hypothetical protein